MSTFRRVQYATTLQMQLGNWQALFGQWRRATEGYLPAHISAGSSGYPRPHFSANAEKDPALLAPKHLICRHSYVSAAQRPSSGKRYRTPIFHYD